ncbi:MAG: hypothetical protein LIO93_03600 [Bacteroidales bacterium]|nr:hypothetical protein [Bacteroidales bacterium]
MKKSFFIPIVCIGMIFSLTGCLDSGNGENYEIYQDVLTVVGHDEQSGSPTFNFFAGTVLAEDLPAEYSEVGTTLIANFKIDFNSQKTGTRYYQATELYELIAVPQQGYEQNVEFSPEKVNPDGVIPINSIQYFQSANQLGRVFFATQLDSVSKNEFNFNMVYVPKEVAGGGVQDTLKFYLYASQYGSDIEKTIRTRTNSFNMYDLFKLGKDTTDRYTNIAYKSLNVNISYVRGINRDGELVWDDLVNSRGSKDIELLLYKRDVE